MAIAKQKISDISEEQDDNKKIQQELEEKREEIDESLSEIYQDEDGNMVDVKKIDIRKGKSFLFWFLTVVISAAIVGGGAGYYYKVFGQKVTGENIELSISSDNESIIAGKEYSYTLNYRNGEKVEIGNIQIKVSLPDNFLITGFQPQPQTASSSQNNLWTIGRLLPYASGQIKIKGKLIGKKGDRAPVNAEMIYTPKNFSAEFKKSAAIESILADNGLEITADSYVSVLVGEESKISVTVKAKAESYLEKLKMKVILPEKSGLLLLTVATSSNSGVVGQSGLRPEEWLINKLSKDGITFTIPVKALEKANATEDVALEFYYPENDKDHRVSESIIRYEIVKSDLNLGIVINGSRNDQGINFGDTLQYSVTFSNKGDSEMKDIVIMAVIEGDYLDWTTLKDEKKGIAKQGMITWAKDEIPELAILAPGSEGAIDFTIQALPQSAITSNKKNYEIRSYAQFSIGNHEEIKASGDSKSNIITSKINTDLELKETVRYFDKDNIPVGSGPLPPKVGEATSYKVYWSIGNNLHEINNLKVEASLPPYVAWNEKNFSSIGTVSYNQEENKIIWEIGRLPVIYDEIKAEFSISVTPKEEDLNKILVLLPGTKIEAIDTETDGALNKTSKAKTTKLEDDDIATGDGRVE